MFNPVIQGISVCSLTSQNFVASNETDKSFQSKVENVITSKIPLLMSTQLFHF